MNPVDDYLRTKTASPWNQLPLPGMARAVSGISGKEVGKNLGIGALQAAGGLTIMGIAGAAQRVMQSISKKRHFDTMMENNPDLEEQRQTDPMRFNAHYSSLRRLNPEFASDPILAGTYLRKMNENPETAGAVLVESLQGRRHMGGPSFSSSVGTGGFKANIDS